MMKISVTNTDTEHAIERGHRVFDAGVENVELIVDDYAYTQISSAEVLDVKILDDDYDISQDQEVSEPRPAGEPTNSESNGVRHVEATDAARKKAKELDVGLSGITGTGKGGKITVEDVSAHYEHGAEKPIREENGELISGNGGDVWFDADNGEEDNPADKGTESGKDKGEAPGNDKGSDGDTSSTAGDHDKVAST